MPYRATAGLLIITGLLAPTAPVFAMGAGVGCTNLPEHDRAVGTIENGPYSCGMSMEEAQKILARDNPQPTPAPRHHHRKRIKHD